MTTIHCLECDKPLPELANYCPVCGTSRTSSSHRSDDQWLEIRRSATWSKEVVLSPNRANPTPLPPRPARSRPPMWNTWRRIRHRISPAFIIWISILVFLICGSVFGIVTTRGSGVSSNSHELALQVTPDNVSVGATVIINGEHFKPYGKIGLTRDTSIPIQDTANARIIEADSKGNFTDTLPITPDWEAGLHTVHAEDAFMHKIASFSIMVTGYASSLRPAHLRVSVDTLDLGSGDQTTNTTKTIILTNIGEGLISWQANSSQSWLLLSPPRGTFTNNHSVSVMAAIDRSKLKPGAYSAQINIFSTAGNSTIPVTATVTTLLLAHSALLRTNPALLSFTALDGGSSPSTQTITVSNPGPHAVQWQATTNTNWLFVSPQSALIAPSGSLTVTVSVNSSLLLPGIYNAAITGVNSPYTIFVTVTIIPQCTLLATPGQLNFAGIYLQGKPPAKAVSIEATQSCTASESWTATSNASWLTLDTPYGQTPASPRVGIDISGLSPGTYHSSVTLSSSAGTQTLPVTFTLGRTPVPLVTTAPDTLSFNGTAGQSTPAIQHISITNSGNTGSLNWHATTTGGNWLAVSPIAGTLMTHQSASFNITASVLATMVPGSYNGTVTIVGTDSLGHPALGSPQVLPVSLLVKPTCTLQNPSPTAETFDTKVGKNPASQTFTVSVMGNCSSAVTLAPSIISTSETGWISVVANRTTITNGESATFTVTVTSANLPAGHYEATIQLSALNNSIAMMNMLQGIDVKLTVEVSPKSVVGTPTPTSSPAPVPMPIATPTPSPAPVPMPTATPTPSPTPIPPPMPTPTPTPVSTPVPSAGLDPPA